jgi:hypothetical protein
MKKIFLVICFVLFLLPISSYAFVFWLKSSDNTVENIVDIEKNYNLYLPLVGFIYDPRDQQDVVWELKKAKEKLWDKRIYHITLSPNSYSAQEVIDWKFDAEYNLFFKTIRELNLKVIFRTMHEMNGWWYPWSSNPDLFKQAWVHVWKLARKQGLTETDILFDFSVNHRDMPTKWVPSQSAILYNCETPLSWKVLDYSKECYRFEDYYPWNEFVDVVWFTFYNRWKAIDNRQWLSPSQILYDSTWKTYERVKKLNKPVIIDEVATTSVRYEWNYKFDKSRNEYLTENDRKDFWLHQLREFLINHPEIIAVSYFNTDYTHWLSFKVTWEADWAIINIWDNKVYNWFRDLELFWEKDLNNILKEIFKTQKISIDWMDLWVWTSYQKEINTISRIVNNRTSNKNEKIKLLTILKKTNFKSESINKAINTLYNAYTNQTPNQAPNEA